MLARKMSAYEKEEIRSRMEEMEEMHIPGLKDWTAIRAHLKRHDDEMIGSYEDDINTMLVFAGLFSAVVTAFFIESFQWLEQNDDQLSTRLLAQISLQLAGGPVNQTLIDAANPDAPFTASLSSIWINVLWALSLLHSLAAALGGIIIKQWLREYLLWDSVLLPSREAVFLRHIRYDAWERWKVPEIISMIPAMLELALVTFLCGAVVLFWTLNSAVGIVVTVFGAWYFILVCAAHAMPLIFLRCPYKSTTSWMCLVLWDQVCQWYINLCKRYRSNIRMPDTGGLPVRQRFASWRLRDLQRHKQRGVKISWDSQHQHALQEEMMPVAAEILTRFHALTWVCTSTQDDRILSKVQQCARKFHGTEPKHLYFVAGIHATCQMSSLATNRFFADLRKEYVHDTLELPNNKYGLYTFKSRGVLESSDLWQGRELDILAIRMIGDVLLNVALEFIHDLFPTMPNSDSSAPSAEEMRIFMEALLFLTHVGVIAPPAWRENVVDMLVDFYNRLNDAEVSGPWSTERELIGPHYPGFKAPVLQLLTRMCSVDTTSTGHVSVVSIERASTPTEMVQLSVQLFRNNPHYVRREDRHTFLILANTALQSSAIGNELTVDSDVIGQLLASIDDVARLSLELNIQNLGFYGQFPTILESVVHFAENLSSDWIHLIPPTLIERLADNIADDLLSDEAVYWVEQFRRLVVEHGSAHLKLGSDSTAVSISPGSEHALTWPVTGSTLHSREKPLGESRKMSPDIKQAAPSLSISNPYFPPTPFSLTEGGDRDLELGVVSYDFPSPQIPDSGIPLMSHTRTHTWPY
ncbi:hypothetical protein NM688_g8290 [Phlebia brevispora]|uniref:Uncharacterized protein n=1 Tax=Phlebia brevispora TaxID=194682 RepID=A0ACC1RTX0_9APHY|nr:hypothetical protein NM688_g8290 [Phlebia brevispora]